MLSTDEILNCRIDTLEILLQLFYFQEFIKHCESHIDWPMRIEMNRLSSIENYEERYWAEQELEHKYLHIIPTRHRYSYVIQYTSIIEWSIQKAFSIFDIKIHKKPKFADLLKKVRSEMGILVHNEEQLIELYNLRNRIVHSNGIITKKEKFKWQKSSICTCKSISLIDDNKCENFLIGKPEPEEYILILDIDAFNNQIDETRKWLSQVTSYTKYQ